MLCEGPCAVGSQTLRVSHEVFNFSNVLFGCSLDTMIYQFNTIPGYVPTGIKLNLNLLCVLF